MITQDWPTSAHIRETWPVEYRQFIAMLPFPHFTSPEGILNVAAHFARDSAHRKAHAPDLGEVRQSQHAFGPLI